MLYAPGFLFFFFNDTATTEIYTLSLHDALPISDLLGEYPAVRYYPPSGDLYFDILTRLGEMVSYESVERERKDLGTAQVVVATPKALYLLKKDTLRPLDRQDAEALRQRFDLERK